MPEVLTGITELERPRTVCRFCNRMTEVNSNGTYAIHAKTVREELDCTNPKICRGSGQSMIEGELSDKLQLSIIFHRLLRQLRLHENEAEGVELINNSFNEAVRYLSARCPQCDSDDVTIVCEECFKKSHCRDSHYGECL